jgi:hypothetical protein
MLLGLLLLIMLASLLVLLLLVVVGVSNALLLASCWASHVKHLHRQDGNGRLKLAYCVGALFT